MPKIKFEELKAGHISVLTKAKSPLVTGASESDALAVLVDYVYVTNSFKRATVSAKKGTWFEDSNEYANNFTQAQMEAFMSEHLDPEIDEVNEAKVEVIPDKDDKPKKKAQKSTT